MEFSNVSVTDPNFPVIMPNGNNFIAGNSGFGSVLYMWIWNDQGVNPVSAQINGNITSFSLQPYSQPVPEPSNVALTTSGFVCLTGYKKKRKGFST